MIHFRKEINKPLTSFSLVPKEKKAFGNILFFYPHC